MPARAGRRRSGWTLSSSRSSRPFVSVARRSRSPASGFGRPSGAPGRASCALRDAAIDAERSQRDEAKSHHRRMLKSGDRNGKRRPRAAGGPSARANQEWTFLALTEAARRLAPSWSPTYIPATCAASGQLRLVCDILKPGVGDRSAAPPASIGPGARYPQLGRFGALRSRETMRNETMAKVIGIDLGTTNSCVAVMEGATPKVIENCRGRAHDALDRRLHRRWRAARRPAGQAPGRHQSGAHVLRHQAPDRPPLRRPDDQEGHGPRSLQDHQGAQRRRLGHRRTASNIRPRRFPPSSCRR